MAGKAKLIIVRKGGKYGLYLLIFFRKSGVVFGCNMVYFSFAICIYTNSGILENILIILQNCFKVI